MKPIQTLTILLALTVLGLGVTGCRIVQSAANVPGQAVRAVTPGESGQLVVDPVQVQQRLMRFSDGYLTTMIYGLDRLRRGTNELDPAELLRWKLTLGTETVAIASGPNAVGNLLDMTVFVTVTRRALEEYWQPKMFGASAQPMLDSCRNFETDIWQFTSEVMTPEQQTQLKQAIDLWYKQNPLPESVVAARALGFASEVAKTTKTDKSGSGNVFSLLRLDPLAGLDPATREIAQTRLLAERALYVSQKMPTLLRWQTELLALNSTQLPAVQQLVTNSTHIAASADRFAALAEKIPGQVSTERAEIFKALHSQEKDVSSLLASGTQMSDSLNITITTFDALMKRFGVGETNSVKPATTNAEPFRIQDYTATAAQLEVTARQLTELLVTLDQTLGSTNLAKLTAQVGPVVQQAQTGGKEVVDYAFWKGVLLLAIALVFALIYRFLAGRFLNSKTNANPTRQP